jgi:hypothetical protein
VALRGALRGGVLLRVHSQRVLNLGCVAEATHKVCLVQCMQVHEVGRYYRQILKNAPYPTFLVSLFGYLYGERLDLGGVPERPLPLCPFMAVVRVLGAWVPLQV